MAKGDPPYKRAGFSTQYGYTRARKAARDWSRDHSRTEASAYKERMKPEEFALYYKAYVSPTTSTFAVRARGGHKSKYLERYLVDVLKYMTREEFRALYAELV